MSKRELFAVEKFYPGEGWFPSRGAHEAMELAERALQQSKPGQKLRIVRYVPAPARKRSKKKQ